MNRGDFVKLGVGYAEVFYTYELKNDGARGKLYCLGVGPGDPELMTVKAVRIIAEADVIAYPHSDKEGVEAVALGIACAACKSIEGKEKIQVQVPMTRDRVALEESLQEAAEKIKNALKEGKSVAYVTLGDPMIYSTYSSLGTILNKWGYVTEYVPGVTSFCAAAARLGIPLAKGKERLSIIPAQGEIPALRENENLVLMMAGSKLKELKSCAALSGLKVAAVSNCGMEGEATYYGADAIPDEAGYFMTVIAKP